jgi:hypothetical protein
MMANRSFARARPAAPADATRPALCPLLKAIRTRLRNRILEVDEAILAHAQPAVNGSIGIDRLVGERASLVHALELIVSASDRNLTREARRRWLEALDAAAPACVTPKSRRRLRLLIEGLSG